ncbi:hypothetical protein RND71_009714 [Anisodus tanguticus]|uniref:Uncharacterized protein n=1 Tax=Anisodus tanguticus TaxID=243964 RepID=A0AAE1VRH1_9SOLA|nr:hypothetical protein RND71_009714 [Anisodus tanguticus]
MKSQCFVPTYESHTTYGLLSQKTVCMLSRALCYSQGGIPCTPLENQQMDSELVSSLTKDVPKP